MLYPDDRSSLSRALKFLEAETDRRLRTLTESIALDDPAREEAMAWLAVHKRRVLRAIDAMREYFEASLERLDIISSEADWAVRRWALRMAQDNFAADAETWFCHFLGQVNEGGVYRRDPWLDTWPPYPDPERCPPVHIRMPGAPTAEHTIIATQRDRIDELEAERDASHDERRALHRRLAELEAAGTDSSLDDFQRSLNEFAGPDADAAERAEVWVQQRTAQYESLVPQDDLSRRVKVTRFERKLRERAEVALEAWRRQREEAIGGEA